MMGYNIIKIVNLVTHDYDNNPNVKEIYNFVTLHPEYFCKSDRMTNSYVNVTMFYDGSKEGWAESEQANILREEFIQLCRTLEYGDLYVINHPEDSCATLYHEDLYRDDK